MTFQSIHYDSTRLIQIRITWSDSADLALVVDTSAHPRAAHPRAVCYKCYDGSICPHHKVSP